MERPGCGGLPGYSWLQEAVAETYNLQSNQVFSGVTLMDARDCGVSGLGVACSCGRFPAHLPPAFLRHSMKDTLQKLSTTTVFLHWIVALFMIVLMGVGWYMAETKTYALYGLHKSFGVVIAVFVLWRVIHRLINGMPKPLGQQGAGLNALASLVHWVLLIGTVLFPLSGMMMSVMGGHGLQLFGLELIANNPDLANPGKNLPLDGDMARNARQVHGLLLWVMLTAIVLHVAGALKHHLVDKDGTLKRIMGKPLP